MPVFGTARGCVPVMTRFRRELSMRTTQLHAHPRSESTAAPRVAEEGSADTSLMVAFKTPMTPRPSTARLPGKLTLRQALAELQRVPPKDEAARRLVHQLGRETSGPHDVLVLGPQ